ncbi:sulfurtransferase [Bradymonas sediminis]|nr:rhodanese-like domain-containing protein [Bradymonas sediminis]TDP71991.1 thiosulfate/3-mercaptopyruvate sulfurtransferase [Bradymonas sediminis]
MNNKRFRLGYSLLGLLLLIGFIGACGSSFEIIDDRPEEERNAVAAPLKGQVVIELAEFEQLAGEGATIIDVRKLEEYEQGHYPGAVHNNGGREWKDDFGILIADIPLAQQLVRDLGVDNARPVVIYGSPRSTGAFRLHWTLEYYGHGEVYVYAPGYPALEAGLNFTPETDAPEITKGDFVLAKRPSAIATADEVRAAIDDENAVLIDTRRETEFEGTEVRQSGDQDDPRQGNIPGAIWYYWENVFDENDNLRPKEEIRAEFEAAGFLKEGAVVVAYCQTGTRSTVIYGLLRWLGEEPKNYDGSWAEWSRGDYPIAQPQLENHSE